MSGYYDEYDEPRKDRSHRSSRKSKPVVYEEEEIIESRGSRAPRTNEVRDVARRRRDSSSSTEEIHREFPPGDGAYIKRKTTTRDKYPPRARSAGRNDRYDSYGDPRRSDPSFGGGSGGRRGDRRSKRRDYDSYSDADSESVSPPPRRRKSLGEQAMAALGVGGLAGAAASGKGRDRDRRSGGGGGRDRSRSRGGRRRRDYSSSRSRSRSVDQVKKWQQAAKAAGTAAVLEAWKSRGEPGGIAGAGKRIATAAIGAAGVNGLMDRDPDKHSKRHVIESAIGGLASNRLINGKSRSRSRSRHGKDSGSGPGLGGLVSAAGLAAVAGKALKNYRDKSRDRSGSRDRGRGRRDSYDSYDSRSPPPKRARSKSISAYVSRGVDAGMAKLGLSDKKSSKSSRHYSDDDEYYNPRPRGGELVRGGGGGSGGVQIATAKDSRRENAEFNDKKDQEHNGTDTDSYSSSEEEKKHKKMHRKEFITAGLASVATIHAAHNVYQSMEKRNERHKKVLEGKLSPEEAKKLKNRARLQDVASVGVAALGIKGAVSEWKEMKEQREEFHEAQHRLEEKREHRRAKAMRTQSGSGRRSEPDMNSRYRYDGASRYSNDPGPRYQDANPYASSAVPPPPMGSARY